MTSTGRSGVVFEGLSLSRAQSNHRIDGGVVESTRGQLLSQLQSLYSSSQGKIGTLYEEDPIAHAAVSDGHHCIATVMKSVIRIERTVLHRRLV